MDDRLTSGLAWPWLLNGGIVCLTAAIALSAIPELLFRKRERPPHWGFPAAGVLGVALAAVAFGHADDRLNGLPGTPALSPLLGWPLVLSLAMGAAGLRRCAVVARDPIGRRTMAAAGLLLALSALCPQVVAAGITVPVVVAFVTSVPAGLLALTLGGLGILLMTWAVRRAPVAPRTLGRTAAVLLGLLPAWHLLHVADGWPLAVARALWTGACAITVIRCALRLMEAAPSGLWIVVEWVAVAGMCFVFWLLRFQGLGYSATDEGIYLYAAKVWAEGLWPYRDFFFSHPAVHILIPMLVFKVLGFSYLAGRLVAPFAGFGTGLVLWRCTRRHFGPVAGVAALGFCWLAVAVEWGSTTFTGAEIAMFFLALGTAAAMNRHAGWAGIWFGLASGTAVYASSGFLAFLPLALTAPPHPSRRWWRHDAARMAGAFALSFGGLNLVFYAVGGARYLDGVYRYHLLKAARDAHHESFLDGPAAIVGNLSGFLRSHEMVMFLAYHGPHAWFAVLGLVLALAGAGALAWSPRKWWATGDGRAPLLFLGAMGALLTLAQLNERYDHYFLIVFPPLIPLSGLAVRELLRRGNAAVIAPGPRAPWKAAVAIVVALLWVPLNAEADAAAFPEEYGPKHGEIVEYKWSPAPVLPALGELVHALFWSPTRRRGDAVSGLQIYLTSRKRYFSLAGDIADYVRSHTAPNDTITGASDFAPLIAMLSDRRLAGNQIDTNNKVFKTGVLPEQEFWTSACADHLAYVVGAERSYFEDKHVSTMPLMQRDFQLEKTFEEPELRSGRIFPIPLFHRRHEPPSASCTW